MIQVLEPGLFTTIQDLGRLGLGHLGVPTAGAVDTFSLRAANRLVGNMDGATGFEMTGRGAILSFDAPASIALTGGVVEATLDGQPLAMHQTIRIKAGAAVDVGAINSGFRTYLAVGGGLDVPQVLGSASTDAFSGLGPAPLLAGIQIPVVPQADGPGFYLRAPPGFGAEAVLRVLPGPQEDWFTAAARSQLLDGEYRVLPQSDRGGLRLIGAKLERSRKGELPSMGMVAGAIQVPGSGQPIALLANHGATGGYPVIANVISADLGRLAQLAPGTSLRFSLVDRAEALVLLKAQEERLARDIIPADAGLLAARALMTLAGRHASLKQATVTEGGRKIRIRRSN
ncbi:MAG: biotin-dependent carboxyltransferase family protein [Gammaproteobacteria bacterium]